MCCTSADTPDELEAPVLSLVNATTVRVEWSAPTNADPEELNILYYMVSVMCAVGECDVCCW